MKPQTWQAEAAAQAALYLGAIYAQFGTLERPELVLALGLWLLGRVSSRNDRQREKWEAAGVGDAMRAHLVECAAGTSRDLRLASLAFGLWGLYIGAYLTLADVAWNVCYPFWRRLWRQLHPRGSHARP